MNKYKSHISQERWQSFAKDIQILNIASEFSRARSWLVKNDQPEVQNCLNRAFELIDATITDNKWRNALKEWLRFRELLADFYISEQKDINHFNKLFRTLLYFNNQSAKVVV